jgi:transcriptional regulator with XRE-family HTH domain
MNIGPRLRALRKEKKLSQGDIQKRSGLLRPYLSRVENGHTIPTVETLGRIAKALEVPLYELFYDGKQPPAALAILKRRSADDDTWGSSGIDAAYLRKIRRLLGRMDESDRRLILQVVLKMAHASTK